jgi:hypothetical protein
MGKKRNTYNIWGGGKPAGKRALEIPRRRGEDDIRMEVTEIGWEGVDWFVSGQRTSGGLL